MTFVPSVCSLVEIFVKFISLLHSHHLRRAPSNAFQMKIGKLRKIPNPFTKQENEIQLGD